MFYLVLPETFYISILQRVLKTSEYILTTYCIGVDEYVREQSDWTIFQYSMIYGLILK